MMKKYLWIFVTIGLIISAVAHGQTTFIIKDYSTATPTETVVTKDSLLIGGTGTAIELTGDAVAADVLYGKTFMNASGTATGVRPCVTLPKTLQTTSYYAGDDGDIEAGYSCSGDRFTNNGDGTITDNTTGLMWTKSDDIAAGTVAWTDALLAANNLTTGGYTDWRLPNVTEFQSIINLGQANNNTWLGTFGFDNIPALNFWTSTTSAGATTAAWYINRNTGALTAVAKTTNTLRVMAVRGGSL